MNSYVSMGRIPTHNVISLQNLNGLSIQKQQPIPSPMISLQSQMAPSRKVSFGEGLCINFEDWKQFADQTGP